MLYFSKMQEIRDQIQKHLDDEIIQNEMKEQEKQQIRENQEKMDLEDLKVHAMHNNLVSEI